MLRVADVVIGFISVPTTIIVGAPFYLLLVRRLDRRLGYVPTSGPGWLRATGFTLLQTVRLSLLASFGRPLALPFILIPALNVAIARP